MGGKLSVIIAGDKRCDVEKTLGPGGWHLLADNGFINRTTVGGVGFCRDSKNQSLIAVLPKAFGLYGDRSKLKQPSELKENVFRLIRVFNKIKKETCLGIELIRTNNISSEIEKLSDPVLDSLEAALKLRKDYLSRGAYLRKKPEYLEASRKCPIAWSRTIKKYPPLLNDDGVLFPGTIHRSRKKDFLYGLTRLQLFCVKEILELTGERHLFRDITTPAAIENKISHGKALSVLGKIKSEIFDERGQILLKSISAYLQLGRLRSTQKLERDQVLSYTAEFERIWEHVLRRLFARHDSDRGTSSGEWYAYESGKVSVGISPQVDVFTKVSGDPVILDAKDYRILYPAGDRFGSPGDYYKQIIYASLLGAGGEKMRPLNILLFPGIDQKRLFLINGYHKWEKIPGSVVFEVTVDYTMAIQAWLGEKSLDVGNELQKLIKELKEFEAIMK
jgi:hypothetical protein